MKIPINIICICCPYGCNLSVIKSPSLEPIITGNKCPRGNKYAKEEIVSPKRIVTTTVKVMSVQYSVVSVKTNAPIPKDKIFTAMNILASIQATLPIKAGDIIVKNIANTNIDVVATKTFN